MGGTAMMYMLASITQMLVFTIYQKEVFELKHSILWMPFCWACVEVVGYSVGGFTKPMAKIFLLEGDKILLTVGQVLMYILLLQGVIGFMCKGEWKKNFTLSAIHFAIYMIIGIVLTQIVERNTDLYIFYMTQFYRRDAVVVILVQTFMLIILEMIGCYKEWNSEYKTDLKKWLIIFLVSIVCFIYMFSLTTKMLDDYTILPNVGVENHILFLGITLFMYCYYFISLENRKREIEHRVYEKQIDMYQEWHQGMQYKKDEIRAFRHDINNHLSVMKNLCERGEREEKEKESLLEIKKYIDTIGKTKICSFYDTDSGNLILDSVIDLKKSYALSKGILFQTEIQVPEQMKYNNFDVVILLGNLLDNAIEACESLEEKEERKIVLKVNYKMGNLFMTIQNSYHGHRDGEAGTLTEEVLWKTTKKDWKNHGIGMKNIMNIIKKYDGVIKWEAKEKTFQMDLLLYEFDEKK